MSGVAQNILFLDCHDHYDCQENKVCHWLGGSGPKIGACTDPCIEFSKSCIETQSCVVIDHYPTCAGRYFTKE